MKYIAKHYVKVAGRMVTPGEIFEADIPPQKEERLLRLGAIQRDETPENDASKFMIPTMKNTQTPPEEPEDDTDDDDMDGFEEADEGDDDGENADEGNATDDADDGYEEAENEAPPEIDVMDGVGQPSATPAPETAPAVKESAPDKKKTAGKPANKQKGVASENPDSQNG